MDKLKDANSVSKENGNLVFAVNGERFEHNIRVITRRVGGGFGGKAIRAMPVEIDILTGESRILQTDIIYDCGQSLNPAIDLGQIEGAFVQGVGFFMLEEYLTNEDGLVVSDGTLTYKIPTIDTIPEQFNVDVLNTGHHQNRVFSSKASDEPPLLLAASVHCATRAAIKAARKQLENWGKLDGVDSDFNLEVPAGLAVVKTHCGLDYA